MRSKNRNYHEVDSTDKETFIHTATSEPVEVDSYEGFEVQGSAWTENEAIMGDAGEIENPLQKDRETESKDPVGKSSSNTVGVGLVSNPDFKEPHGESRERKKMRKLLLISYSVLILVVLAISCATPPKASPPETYTVLLNRRPYDFNIQEQRKDKRSISTSAIGGTLIKLQPDGRDPRLMHTSRTPGTDKWFLSDHPEISIEEVALMPYYSLYSYRILTNLKSSGVDILDPACPPETKYLVLFIVGKAGIPWAGCVI